VKLHAYQDRVIAETGQAFTQVRAVLLQMATGAGKTHVAAELLRMTAQRGRRAVFAAHLDALVGDTVDRLRAAGIHTGRVQAGELADPTAPVQVCSLQTLHARGEAPPGDLVILDECHRAVAPTVKGVLERYPNAKLLGLTATPERGDGAPLGDVFQRMVCGPTTRELVELGLLVPCDVVRPDKLLDGVAMEPLDALRTYATGRPAVVFCKTVSAARALASQAGHRVACVDGEMDPDDRRRILAAFQAGELDVITNCMVLTEGWNAPRAEVCILARGCQHDGTFLQMVGRVLRASPGKTRALLVDLPGVVHRHGLPDEPRTYSLHGRGIRRAKRLEPLRTCPACAAVFEPVPVCPRCQFAFPPPEPPKVRKSVMSMGGAIASRGEKRASFDALVEEARQRGYKPGWVGMRFKSRWGHWPPFVIPKEVRA